MSTACKKILFIFRRDLRLEDNTGLLSALKQSQEVIPCFIFDPAQVTQKNTYKSDRAIIFMLESLSNLAGQLHEYDAQLYIFTGDPAETVAHLIKQLSIDAVQVNRDYTPYSKHRDAAIQSVCGKAGIPFFMSNDALLTEPEGVYTQRGTPYKVFTPFFRAASELVISPPQKLDNPHFYTAAIPGQKSLGQVAKELTQKIPKDLELYVHGGRTVGLETLGRLKRFEDYDETRDIPSIDTTLLSGHTKFGTVSIREVYHAIRQKLGAHHTLIKQLYWRDFFTHVAFHNPEVFGAAFNEKYAHIPWSDNTALFERWCNGTTGFPIVDAGMRQLNATGFMHNRVRMIVGSFLVKDLHINWLWGERYFAQKLLDYDPAVNNGNWQWVASTGVDAQPYFRIFNPWTQQQKCDPDAEYIRQWIPELRTAETAAIHAWYKKHTDIVGYPKPIVDHKKESALAKKIFKEYSS